MVDDGESEKNETNRILLQIYHDRNNQLSNMLIALNGFILAFIAGIITLLGTTLLSSPQCPIFINSVWLCNNLKNDDQNFPVLIALNVLVIVLILWRYYAHYIDNDIVNEYLKILRCENLLNIQSDLTLMNSLENPNGSPGLTNFPSYNAKISQNICPDQKFSEKMRIIEQLIRKKKMGCRGHYWFNVITIFSITALLVTENILLKSLIDSNIITIFIIGILGLLLVIMIFFYCYPCKRFQSLFKENKMSFNQYLLRFFLLACAAIVLLLVFCLNIISLQLITLIAVLIKDILIFIFFGILIVHFAQSDPTDTDIENIST